MLDLIVVALLQAVAGDPAPAEAAQEPAQTEAEAQNTQTANAEEPQRRRCRAREITGTRLQSLVTCRRGNGDQDQDTRDTMHDLQRPTGLQGN